MRIFKAQTQNIGDINIWKLRNNNTDFSIKWEILENSVTILDSQ